MAPATPADKRRSKLAELALLERYDQRREVAGHDYGSGQRGSELMRRARELHPAGRFEPELHEELASVTPAELLAAFERVAAKRLRRVETDANEWGWTPTAQRTARTWRELRLSLERAAAGERRAVSMGQTAIVELPELTPAGARFAVHDAHRSVVARIALAAANGGAEDWPASYRRTAIEACNAKGSDTGAGGGGHAAPPPSSEDPTESPEFRAALEAADLGRPALTDTGSDGVTRFTLEGAAHVLGAELEAVARAPYDRAELMLGLGDFDGGEAA